jgi:hypothetical protein
MLDRYAEFGMRRSPKEFKGRVVHSAQRLDILLASQDVTMVDLSDTHDSTERVDKVAHLFDQSYSPFQIATIFEPYLKRKREAA